MAGNTFFSDKRKKPDTIFYIGLMVFIKIIVQTNLIISFFCIFV